MSFTAGCCIIAYLAINHTQVEEFLPFLPQNCFVLAFVYLRKLLLTGNVGEVLFLKIKIEWVSGIGKNKNDEV